MTSFGTTVFMWRLERQLSQEALARNAGLSRPNLSAIERGKREVSLKTLRALALALDVRPGMLVDGTAPGGSAGKPLSRERLERIADAVITHEPAQDEEEQRLAELLQTLLHTRLSTLRDRRKPLRIGKRRLASAWLQLSAACSPRVVQSLIERVGDRERSLRVSDDVSRNR